MILSTLAGVGAALFLVSGAVAVVRPSVRASRQSGVAALGLGGVLLAAALGLSFVNRAPAATAAPAPVQVAATAPGSPLQAQIDRLEDQIGTFDDQAKPDTPMVTACTGLEYGADRLACAKAGALFAEAWPRAHHGDLLAARLVARCLTDGCDIAVGARPAEGCAWSLVVAAIGSEPEVDRPRAHRACAGLDASTLAAVKAQALELGRQIPALKA